MIKAERPTFIKFEKIQSVPSLIAAMTSSILSAYGFDSNQCILLAFGTGLINHTWLLKYRDKDYILQKINHSVFKNPYYISENIHAAGEYLKQHFPGYFFVTPMRSIKNKDVIYDGENYWRIFPFVKDSVTFTTLHNPALAFEAAKQFGKFTHLLSGFDATVLKETIPDFHNLTLRYQQFEEALLHGSKERVAEAQEIIKQVKKYRYIVDEFENIKKSRHFKKRVMHHDTKISNVLFDSKNKGLCVIDLDTVMPGYFISDVGDMMRTYLSAAGEEEKDFTKIVIREDFFDAVAQGYLSEMKTDLTEEERRSFIYSGKFMTYMQAVRFLADYLCNDVYYGSKYEGHNFVRAKNQLYLLERLVEKEEDLLLRTKQHTYFLYQTGK